MPKNSTSFTVCRLNFSQSYWATNHALPQSNQNLFPRPYQKWPRIRGRLRQDSAFFFGPRSGVKNLWKTRSHFYFRQQHESTWSLLTSLVNYKCCLSSVALMVCGIWIKLGFSKFKKFLTGSGLKNFGTGAKSKSENVTPANSDPYPLQHTTMT